MLCMRPIPVWIEIEIGERSAVAGLFAATAAGVVSAITGLFAAATAGVVAPPILC